MQGKKIKQTELILFLHRVTCVFMIQFTNLFTLLFSLSPYGILIPREYMRPYAQESRSIAISEFRRVAFATRLVGRQSTTPQMKLTPKKSNMHMQQSCANFAGMTTNGWRTSEATTQHMKPQNRAAFLTLRICINDMADSWQESSAGNEIALLQTICEMKSRSLGPREKRKATTRTRNSNRKKLSIRLARRPVVWLVVAGCETLQPHPEFKFDWN